MADERMVSLTAGATNVQSCAIDTKLSNLFNGTDCVIHKRLQDFLERLVKSKKVVANGTGLATLAKRQTTPNTGTKRAVSTGPNHPAAWKFPITGL